MNKINSKKIRLLYIPFLISTVSISILYTFLNWLLISKLHIFEINEFFTNCLIPIFLPWAFILFYLRKRLKLLDLNKNNPKRSEQYSFFLWIALAAPGVFAQFYVDKASGKLTSLVNIEQYYKSEPSKYYTLKNFYIDKKNIGVHSSFEIGGKHNENFNMTIFIALPILKNTADTLKPSCAAWLGYRYFESMSNKVHDSIKEKEYNRFAKESQFDFDKRNFNEFIYLELNSIEEHTEGYKQAISECKKYVSQEPNVLLAKNEAFEKRTGSSLFWFLGTFITGALLWLWMIAVQSFNGEALKRFEQAKELNISEKDEEISDFIEFFKPREGYFVTPILIYLNVGIYLIMAFYGLGFISFKGKDLLAWGANFKPLTINGEWWRLLTSTFLHGGIMHLLMNIYGLIFVSVILEPLLGKTKFLTAYLITGILASCASIWWYDATVSVGASGAIFGLYGLFLALLLTKVFEPEFGKAFLISTLIFVGFNLLNGLAGGIDNAAHIGGLVSGFVFGLIFRMTLKKETSAQEN